MTSVFSETLQKDFWQHFSTFTSSGLKVHEIETQPPGAAEHVPLSLAVDGCWLSFMTNVFYYREEQVQQKNESGIASAENPMVRRRMIDAWIELELTRAVYHAATSSPGVLENARLARIWVLRCLKIFAVDIPLYMNFPEFVWQVQARKFIQGVFKTS